MVKNLTSVILLICALFIFVVVNIRSIKAQDENIIWTGTFEDGTVDEWQPGLTTFPWISGPGVTNYTLVSSGALTKNYSVRISIDTTNGEAGIRWPRRSIGEDQALPDEAYYSVWFFLTDTFTSEWWNFMQWKRAYKIDDTESSDPVASINFEERDNGSLYFSLNYKVGDDGNYDTYPGKRNIAEAPDQLNIPLRQWVQLECFYRWSITPDGEITCWQDGKLLFSESNIQTEFDYPFSDENIYRQWSVNAYAEDVNPSPYSFFIDDAVISKVQISFRSPTLIAQSLWAIGVSIVLLGVFASGGGIYIMRRKRY
jgi:hypothetical protein